MTRADEEGAVTRAFAVTDPLPVGRVTLEASAGTGKTWSIVGLAARALAEGRCTASELLVVTFARSATRELRSRLLARLDDAAGVLGRAAADGPQAVLDSRADDEVVRALLTGDGDGGTRPLLDVDGLTVRRDRLGDALADIDQATVATIHGFCVQALERLGDVGLGDLLEDEHSLAQDVAADLRLRVAVEQPDAVAQLPWVTQGVELVRAGMAHQPADVVPPPALTDWDRARAWMAVEGGREAAARKRWGRLHTHDDLLRRLADRLDDRVHGLAAAGQVAGAIKVALVDEFQDTDPVQWRILTALFPESVGQDGRTVVLVGDPKQAIYAFRGADVHAYVTARGGHPTLALDVNRRSDDAVVRAVLALFGGRRLGSGIDVPPVRAAAGDRVRGLPAPLVVATVPDDAPLRRTEQGTLQRAAVRDAVAQDVARHAVALLSGEVQISDADTDVDRPLGPGDLAVLVRTRAQAVLVQDHLGRAGVPSVLNGVGDVLASRAARDWLHLLRALDRPSQGGLARLATLGDLIGWSPARVAAADEDDWDALHIALHGWRQVLLTDGVAATARRIEAHTGLAARLLARPDGDRRLTDLRHVAELLHANRSASAVGTPGLIAWLEAGMAEAADSSRPVPPEHLASRLERDGDVVQLTTVHGAKGLEFGAVLAPFLWDVVGGTPVARSFHDPSTGRRRLFVGGRRHPEAHRCIDLHDQQREDEERRLAYVALTRARHHLRVWWAPAPSAASSPLGSLLATSGEVTTTDQALAAVAALQQTHPGLFHVDHVDVTAPVPRWTPPPRPPVTPVLARLDRAIDQGWRRHSYSRLVGDAHAAADEATGPGEHDTMAGLAEGGGPTDGPIDGPTAPTAGGLTVAADPTLPEPVPLGGIRGGADVGSTIHAVLEHVDFAAADLEGALRREVQRQVQRHALDLTGGVVPDDQVQQVVVDGLAAAIRTPLHPDGPALAAIGRADRVDELAFELPVLTHGLDTQSGRLLLGDIADVLDRHLPPSDPLAGYPAALRHDLGVVEVRGFLAGYIDLLARLPGPDGAVLVCDHKTNRLAAAAEADVTVGHFTPQTMAAEMMRHHYPLQALVYLVATHRYLRWRVSGYDPDRHLAGSAYLFLRGMVGPGTPVRDGMVCGVFRWRPPTSLLLDLDRLLSVGVAGREGR